MNGDKQTVAGVPVEKLREHQDNKSAQAQAANTPLPGPLRDAFAIAPDITVGKYKVRPIYDVDFEFLQTLDHPLYKLTVGAQSFGDKLSDLRGPAAWNLCFMFTHSVDEVETLFQTGTAEFLLAARKEFSRMQLGGLAEILRAVFEQFAKYWAPVIGYGAEETEGEEIPEKKSLDAVT